KLRLFFVNYRAAEERRHFTEIGKYVLYGEGSPARTSRHDSDCTTTAAKPTGLPFFFQKSTAKSARQLHDEHYRPKVQLEIQQKLKAENGPQSHLAGKVNEALKVHFWESIDDEERERWAQEAVQKRETLEPNAIYENQKQLIESFLYLFQNLIGNDNNNQIGHAAFGFLYAYRDENEALHTGRLTVSDDAEDFKPLAEVQTAWKDFSRSRVHFNKRLDKEPALTPTTTSTEISEEVSSKVTTPSSPDAHGPSPLDPSEVVSSGSATIPEGPAEVERLSPPSQCDTPKPPTTIALDPSPPSASPTAITNDECTEVECEPPGEPSSTSNSSNVDITRNPDIASTSNSDNAAIETTPLLTPPGSAKSPQILPLPSTPRTPSPPSSPLSTPPMSPKDLDLDAPLPIKPDGRKRSKFTRDDSGPRKRVKTGKTDPGPARRSTRVRVQPTTGPNNAVGPKTKEKPSWDIVDENGNIIRSSKFSR
ncbi:hypothetical protein H0H93_007439, partial [Arthromyces matolae]